ncbi:MAG: acetoin dehydrogenase [Elusimicrobia bacterium]|nr:MAG: acetoin dehydrogenase [Elusimicrobiota bacterium]
MLRLRLCEERLVELYPEQEMRCPVHFSIGQEATPVGVSAALRPDDYAMSGHRSHGHYLAKGGDMNRMFAEFYGKKTGCASGMGGSMHLIDREAGFLGATPIVASTIPIGVGTAFGSKMRGDKKVTAIYFGDGATEEGAFHEAVNFAVLKKLPVLFVCENNLYSVYSPLSVRQPAGRVIADHVRAYGIESLQGDGNDPEEVYRMSMTAATKARRGGGPTFLEFATYRWLEHCGASYDNDLGYRSKAEFERWKKKCPLLRSRKRLLKDKIVTADNLKNIEADIRAEVEVAVNFAQASPFPDKSVLFKNIYAGSGDG